MMLPPPLGGRHIFKNRRPPSLFERPAPPAAGCTHAVSNTGLGLSILDVALFLLVFGCKRVPLYTAHTWCPLPPLGQQPSHRAGTRVMTLRPCLRRHNHTHPGPSLCFSCSC